MGARLSGFNKLHVEGRIGVPATPDFHFDRAEAYLRHYDMLDNRDWPRSIESVETRYTASGPRCLMSALQLFDEILPWQSPDARCHGGRLRT